MCSRQGQWTGDSQSGLLSVPLSKDSLLVTLPLAGGLIIRVYLFPSLEIKASPFTLGACYIGTVCPRGNHSIDLKVPFVKQGFCVHTIKNNKKLSPVKNCTVCLKLQHVCFFQHPNDKYDKANSKQTL